VRPEHLAALDDDGYVVIANALDTALVVRLRRAFEDAQESATQHVRLDEHTPERDAWKELEEHAAVCAAARHVLGRPFRVRDIHGRNPLPGFGQQGLHSDWPPRLAEEPFSVVTAIFMFDDFTESNGATRVVPGSHRFTGAIPKSLGQPLSHHASERIITGSAGSVLVMNGHVWHSGRKNESTASRRAAQMVIVACWLPAGPEQANSSRAI
jgi:ectoine hydroxylase-related dioxygenase (phytanoyl-CoA dioxygenase family)